MPLLPHLPCLPFIVPAVIPQPQSPSWLARHHNGTSQQPVSSSTDSEASIEVVAGGRQDWGGQGEEEGEQGADVDAVNGLQRHLCFEWWTHKVNKRHQYIWTRNLLWRHVRVCCGLSVYVIRIMCRIKISKFSSKRSETVKTRNAVKCIRPRP